MAKGGHHSWLVKGKIMWFVWCKQACYKTRNLISFVSWRLFLLHLMVDWVFKSFEKLKVLEIFQVHLRPTMPQCSEHINEDEGNLKISLWMIDLKLWASKISLGLSSCHQKQFLSEQAFEEKMSKFIQNAVSMTVSCQWGILGVLSGGRGHWYGIVIYKKKKYKKSLQKIVKTNIRLITIIKEHKSPKEHSTPTSPTPHSKQNKPSVLL